MPASAATARTTRADIDEFLEHKRFAAIGLSRNPQDFTRKLIEEFERRGYDVVPVNPGANEIGGHPCVASVNDIAPSIKAALLLTSPSATDTVVRDCAAAGVTHIWMYRGGGQGAVSSAAIAFCYEQSMKVIAGECPFMFLPGTGFPHRVHGLIRKILGTYPR